MKSEHDNDLYFTDAAAALSELPLFVVDVGTELCYLFTVVDKTGHDIGFIGAPVDTPGKWYYGYYQTMEIGNGDLKTMRAALARLVNCWVNSQIGI